MDARKLWCPAAAMVPLFCLGCITAGVQPDGGSAAADGTDDHPAIRAAALRGVETWAYQLTGVPALDLEPLRKSTFDLVVIDYSADGGEAGEFSAEQIAALKSGAGHVKVVLAYMSIGEAEIGRFYFDKGWITPDPETSPDGPFTLTDLAPTWLTEPNPDWPDNFKVRYWEAEWQQVIIHNPGQHPVIGDAPSYLDRIIDAGFDGVYLDIVDAFEYFGEEEPSSNQNFAELMMRFVRSISEYARQTRGQADFLVFPQNGANIIAEEAFPAGTIPDSVSREEYVRQQREAYFAAIDGIGTEDVFHPGGRDEDNPLQPDQDVIAALDTFRAAGLLVLAIDYLTEPESIEAFYERARARGWVPYASQRDLATLAVSSPPTTPGSP